MKVDVLNISGEKTGRTVELADAIYAIEPNDHVLYLDSKRYQINQRQGTSKAKNRNEIKGSTRKIRKQKGGGGARAGSIKNPLFHGGGRIHGPQPRTYDLKLNQKTTVLARKSALSYKVKENNIIVVENFDWDVPKTKSAIELFKALNVIGGKSLVLLDTRKDNVVKSLRNLPKTQVCLGSDVNTYHLLNSNKVVMMEGAVDLLNKILN